MNKYVRGCICAGCTAIRYAALKLLRGSKFRAKGVGICSPFGEITMSGTGKLYIGKNFKMRSRCHVRVRDGAKLEIGDDVSLNYGDMIVCHESITIGNNVQFSPNVQIYDHDHDFRAEDGLKRLLYKTTPISIGNNVWIGANTVILRGTSIGDNCVIGAGSVVKGSVPAGTILVQKRENRGVSI